MVADLLFLAVLVAFFAIAAEFVHACDRVIGPDTQQVPVQEAEAEQVAA